MLHCDFQHFSCCNGQMWIWARYLSRLNTQRHRFTGGFAYRSHCPLWLSHPWCHYTESEIFNSCCSPYAFLHYPLCRYPPRVFLISSTMSLVPQEFPENIPPLLLEIRYQSLQTFLLLAYPQRVMAYLFICQSVPLFASFFCLQLQAHHCGGRDALALRRQTSQNK